MMSCEPAFDYRLGATWEYSAEEPAKAIARQHGARRAPDAAADQ